MIKLIPASRPKITHSEISELVSTTYPDFEPPYFYIAGIRGYYLNTIGQPGVNDRKVYDDAIILVGKDDKEIFTFNANTDPSAFRRSIANLKPGVWPVYTFAKHKNKYLALCQRAGKVTVIRDGDKDHAATEDTGMFGINIHHGGYVDTSSLGCQTIPPQQWNEFMTQAQALAKKYNGDNYLKDTYTYVLLENK